MKRKASPSTIVINKCQRIEEQSMDSNHSSLTRDVISHVVLFVGPIELFRSLPLVCSTWNEVLVASSLYIWKELYHNTFKPQQHKDMLTPCNNAVTWKQAFVQRYLQFHKQQNVITRMNRRIALHQVVSKQRDLELPHVAIINSVTALQYSEAAQVLYDETLKLYHRIAEMYMDTRYSYSNDLKQLLSGYLQYNQRIYVTTYVNDSHEENFHTCLALCLCGNSNMIMLNANISASLDRSYCKITKVDMRYTIGNETKSIAQLNTESGSWESQFSIDDLRRVKSEIFGSNSDLTELHFLHLLVNITWKRFEVHFDSYKENYFLHECEETINKDRKVSDYLKERAFVDRPIPYDDFQVAYRDQMTTVTTNFCFFTYSRLAISDLNRSIRFQITSRATLHSNSSDCRFTVGIIRGPLLIKESTSLQDCTGYSWDNAEVKRLQGKVLQSAGNYISHKEAIMFQLQVRPDITMTVDIDVDLNTGVTKFCDQLVALTFDTDSQWYFAVELYSASCSIVEKTSDINYDIVTPLQIPPQIQQPLDPYRFPPMVQQSPNPFISPLLFSQTQITQPFNAFILQPQIQSQHLQLFRLAPQIPQPLNPFRLPPQIQPLIQQPQNSFISQPQIQHPDSP
jgi:hypothetical protein